MSKEAYEKIAEGLKEVLDEYRKGYEDGYRRGIQDQPRPAYPMAPYPGGYPNGLAGACGCPPNSVCMNAACPRAAKITCTSVWPHTAATSGSTGSC